MPVKIDQLYYELEMRTGGFDKGLSKATSSAKKFTEFMARNPILVAGAVGAALVALGLKAAEMAEKVNKSLKLLRGGLALTEGQLKQLRGELAELSRQTGRTQADLAEVARTAAGNGVASVEDLIKVMRAATKAADATGGDLQTIIGDLDVVLDTFGISADYAEAVLAKLFITARGRTGLNETLAIFRKLAIAVQETGVDFNTLQAAVAAMVDSGIPLRTVASEMERMPIDKMREWAERAQVASDGTREFAEQVALMRADISTESARLNAEWEAAMIELGNSTSRAKERVAPLLRAMVAGARDFLRNGLLFYGKGTPAPATGGDAGATPAPPGGIPGRGTIAPLSDDQRNAIEAFNKNVESQIAALTSTMVDNAVIALQQFQRESATIIAGIRAVNAVEADKMQARADALIAKMRADIARIRQEEQADTLAGRNKPADPQLAAGSQKVPLRLDFSKSNDKLQAEAAAQAKKLADEEAKLSQERLNAINAAHNEYQAIMQGAQGALQLASALGIMNADLSQALQGLVQFGAGVQEFKKLSKAGASSLEQFSAALGIVGAVSSVIQSIGNLFGGGTDPQEEQRRQAQKQNTAAIEELTRRVGELGVVLGDVGGKAVAGVLTSLNAALATLPKGDDNSRSQGQVEADAAAALRNTLKSLGLTMEDAKKIASGLGLSFDGSIRSMIELRRGIEATELTKFASTFAGQMQALRLEFELFDIEKPIDQLKRLQEIGKEFAGGAGPFGPLSSAGAEVLRELGTLNLDTQAGRDAAQKALEDIFKQLQEGTLTTAQLGDLSTDQLLTFLTDFKRTLDEANKTSGPQGETQGFNVSRTITEAQGSLLISTVTTVAYWQEALYKLFAGGGPVTGTLQPPSIIPSATQTTAGGVIDITVNLSITGVLDQATAVNVGGQVVDGMVSRLDSLYGYRLRTRKLLTGDVARS